MTALMPPGGVLLGYKVVVQQEREVKRVGEGGDLEEHAGMLHLSSNEDDAELDGGLLEFHRSSKSSSPDLPAGAEQDHFPLKLHKLLEQLEMEGKQNVLGWNPDGKSFSVFKPKEFASTIMCKHFPRQSKYKSFQRQLNLYAFKRENMGKIKGVYSHDLFVRENRELCKMMKRERGPPAVGLAGAAMVRTRHSSSPSASSSYHSSSGDMKASSEMKKAAAITGGLLPPTGEIYGGSSSWYRPQQDVGAAAAIAQGRHHNHSSSFPTITGNRGASMGLGGNLFLSEQATAASLVPPIHLRGEGGAGGGPTSSSSPIARQHAGFFPSRNTGTTTVLKDETVVSRGLGVLPPDMFQHEEDREDQQDGSHPWPLSASNIGEAGDDAASTRSNKIAERRALILNMTDIAAAPLRHGSYPSIPLGPTGPPQQQHLQPTTSSSPSVKRRTQEHHGGAALAGVLESGRQQEQEMDDDEEAGSIGTIDGLDNLY